MLVGTVIQLVMFILFALSSEALLQYAAFLNIAIGTAFYKPASDAMVTHTVHEEHRKEVFAVFFIIKISEYTFVKIREIRASIRYN